MAKTRLRGAGGRPRQEGERYANGRLKPPGPNQIIVARRKAICDDVTMATCPLDASYARGWISKEEHAAGRAFIAIHVRAGFQGPGLASVRDMSLPTGSADELRANWRDMKTAEVMAIKWSTLSPKEIAAIWDSALRDLGRYADPARAEEFSADANRKWRSIHASLTTLQRLRVDEFCIRETWPRWFLDRANGNMRGHFEDERSTLIEGLRIIGRALEKPRTPAVPGLVETPPPARPSGPVHVERMIYVDQDTGEPVLEVERRTRKSA